MFSKNDNKKINDLIGAILLLKNSNEARKFLRDLLTESELVEFGNRWKVARMLEKKVPYTEIIKETGLSSTTVARVSNWLDKGMGGYSLILNRLNHHHNFSLSRRE
jgi:TrpR-related protein YerC/YecD